MECHHRLHREGRNILKKHLTQVSSKRNYPTSSLKINQIISAIQSQDAKRLLPATRRSQDRMVLRMTFLSIGWLILFMFNLKLTQADQGM